MRLFIAEKPSMGTEIAKVLGDAQRQNGYFKIGDDVVTWAFGHILRQLDPDEYDPKYKKWTAADLPIFPAWKLKVDEKCKQQFAVIKKLIGEADEIVNAGDPDREGQLLIDEILDYVGNTKPVKRILLNALDEKSIRGALRYLRDNHDFLGMKDSALARSRADWLVGMNLTRAYTLRARQSGHLEVLQIGRVKTPTMALVVRREEEIQNFRPVTHYQVKVDWAYQDDVIPSIWQPDESCAGLDPENRLIDRAVADDLLRKIKTVSGYKSAAVSKVENNEKKEAQRLPYSLSALQIDAGKRYGYDPQLVLDTMQQLYEKKLTTYPRSDCDFLPENQLSDAKQILQNLQMLQVEGFPDLVQKADVAIKSRCWNDKKISAHHAIIPTSVKCNFNELSDPQQRLYYMVVQAYLAQFYPVHIYEATKLWIECSDEAFTATGKVIKQMGWKEIYPHKNQEDTEEEGALPDISEGETVKYQDGAVAEKVTNPPKRFTTALLLQAMKEIHKYVKDPAMKTQLKSVSGIGTEATRAGIIEDLTKYNFFTVEKKLLRPTDKAKMMVKILPDVLTYPDTTAIWEDQLAQVEQQEMSLTSFCEKQKSIITNLMGAATGIRVEAAADAVKCPTCGGFLQRRKGKTGFFWGCMNYPDCTATFPDEKGKPGIHLCPVCKKGYLRKLKGKKGDFWSCNAYPNCKTTFNDKGGKPDIGCR